MIIDKITSDDKLCRSKDLIQENIEQLKSLFPEIVSEGKIDFESLQQVLGGEIEDEEEFYRFTWAGKSKSRREAHKPSTGTLRPCKDESFDWDTTENLYIEGDNLEVLKLLQKSYAGKIKLIYIDPPYNTGKDFVYKDNYKDNLRNYQEVTGQIDRDGNKLSTNSDSDGRFHSNWLNMMYPRLRLARNLLKDDGLIFISIDDNEIENLRKICNEIFGEVNYINELVWINNPAGRQIQGRGGATTKEYILCFSKSIDKSSQFIIDSSYAKSQMPDSYKGFDFEVKSDIKGKYIITHELNNGNSAFNEKTRPNLVFDIFYNPQTHEVKTGDMGCESPSGFIRISPKEIRNRTEKYYAWRWSRQKIENENIDLEFLKINEKWVVFSKRRDFSETLFKDTITNIPTVRGSNDIKKLGLENYFDFPKPVDLIKILIKISTNESDIVLDFFAGSSTTAQALLELNLEQNFNRKYIQVQLPEKLDENSDAYKTGFKTISDLAKNRITKVSEMLKNKYITESTKYDLGFKVFKLDSSNIKSWDGNPDNLESSLFDSITNIKSDRTEEDILYEILLKYGLDLTLPIEERDIQGIKVFNVGMGSLFICLGDEITSKISKGIGEWKEECDSEVCRVIFKDNGLTDVEKTNSVQILKRFGINEIRSI